MDSASDRRPFRDALAALTASDHTDEEIRNFLRHWGHGRVDAATRAMEWREEKDFWEAAAAEGDSPLSPSLLPISPATIQSVYASFADADEDTIGYFCMK